MDQKQKKQGHCMTDGVCQQLCAWPGVSEVRNRYSLDSDKRTQCQRLNTSKIGTLHNMIKVISTIRLTIVDLEETQKAERMQRPARKFINRNART